MEMERIIKLIKTAAAIQTFMPEDELTKVVSSYHESGELDEVELELVSAARGASYQAFLERAGCADRKREL